MTTTTDTTSTDNAQALEVGTFLGARIPGYNTDRIHVAAGLAEAATILGGLTQMQDMVIALGLNEWRRGEEDRGQRTLLSVLDLTAVYRVVAAARAAGERAAQ